MSRLLAILSLIATGLFIIAILALHVLRPDINPMVFGISFYGPGDFGFMLDLALVLVGLSGIALALALWPAPTTAVGRAGLLLLIAWGLLQALAGVFPVDAPGAQPTQSGAIHNVAGMNFLLIAPALLLIELSSSAASGSGRTRTISFWLAWLLVASALLLFIFNGPFYSLQVGGAFQRLYWLVLVLWLLFKASQVWQREKETGPTT